MKIELERTGTVTGFKRLLDEMFIDPNIRGIFILACDANNFSPETTDAVLQEISIPVFGGIFPEIIYGQEKLSRGTILAGLPVTPNIQIIPHLSYMEQDYDDVLDDVLPDIGTAKTMFVVVDGLSKRISALIDSLFNIFGLELNYIGGGAGSLSFQQKPCLFTNSGLLQDSALLALCDLQSGIGVQHGWKSISGPFKVTEVDCNIVKTLDWEPAFDVYRKIVEHASGKRFQDDNFFDIAKGYPLGINKLGTEKIVRDPVTLGNNGELICVGEVPEECYVDILSGDVASLIEAAGNALRLSLDAFPGQAARRTTLFIDCISRVLFLEKEFQRELQAAFDEDTPLFGALTLGEIANSGKDYLEFYNKTAVIAALEG
jgi:hypothetical protein